MVNEANPLTEGENAKNSASGSLSDDLSNEGAIDNTRPKKGSKEVAEKPKQNIRFVGKKEVKDENGKFVSVTADPPENLVLAGKRIELPSAEDQLKGFYHKDAVKIKRALPEQFKTPTTKDGGEVDGES